MNEITTIDLGSNSFRVLTYDCNNHKIIKEYHKIVGTADGLVESGNISNEAVERIVSAIQDSIEKLGYNPNKCIGVTTAAMRNANNSSIVLDEIYKQTGLKLNIISAEEEARLTFLAVKYALKRENIDSNRFVLLDIGGGSTELIVNNNENIFIKSFDFGIVTLEQAHKNIKNLLVDLDNKSIFIKEYLDGLYIDFENFEFIATSGTPTTIAAIKHGLIFTSYDKNIVNGTNIKINDLNNCMKLLNSSSSLELYNLFGTNKKSYIEVGILIYKMIFNALNKRESIVFDDGLREGVAVDFAENNVKLIV